jgi:hypothetical protein
VGRATRGCHGGKCGCLILPQPKWHWIATSKVAKRQGYGPKERLCARCQLSDLQQCHSSNEVIRSASDGINGVLQLGRALFSFLALAIENCWTAQRMVEELPPIIDQGQASVSQRRRLGMREKQIRNHDNLNPYVMEVTHVLRSEKRLKGEIFVHRPTERDMVSRDKSHVPGNSIWPCFILALWVRFQ